ncbi:MAG TPA: extracellular solute-binding protein [Acidimicrobiales bacterium]|nr:extracellular solute-binding protein [Acidimicrobiales bacterium]
MALRVALVGGPMYDGLYSFLPADVDMVVHADHPTLNRQVAEMLAAGERIDLLATHSKYAPSQAAWLRPLDELVPADVLTTLAPDAVGLCRFEDSLLCVPRNIDVRVLWWRTDVLDAAPDTWADLAASGQPFGFPGRESGLFGTFFELVVSHGGRLFDDDVRPTMTGPEAVAAVETLCALAANAPDDLPTWHYDQVDAALLDGRVALAAAWPGGYGPIRASALYDRLAPAPYPAGPVRRVSYAGCHGWAIPTTCVDVEGALDLLVRLCSEEAAVLDASGGSVCANTAAFAAVTPVDDVDAERLQVTRETIAGAMITYPPLARFPEIEDAGWGALNAALRGELDPKETVAAIQRAAEEALADR